ncbi:MAG: zinc ribbon domain-containing protein [Elusimicrobia bacterium]|nr:zinc ribbon domain-containing protein [Elusimicrobiota bacterium]
MISRCPSCGAPAPDEARQCRACGWDFVANKKGEKKPEPPKKTEPGAEKPKSSAPPAPGGLSLPPARGGSSDVPATGLGMARLPKVEPGGFAAGAPDENPFALPVARNLGPKPGESLFAAPPPAAEAKLPEARPKEAPAPEPEEPPRDEPARKKEEPPKKEPPKKEPPKKEPPKKEAPKKIEAPKPEPPPAEEEAVEEDDEDEDDASAALFLPSSTKEIVVEPAAKRAKAEARGPDEEELEAEPDPAKTRAPKEPAAAGAPKPGSGRQSAVYIAALAGGALGLFSVGAIFMMLRSDPQGAARPTGSSPFGKRSPGDASVTPGLDAPAPSSLDMPKANTPPISPAPSPSSDAPAPTSLPAPAVGRPLEPPKPGAVESSPIDAPKAGPPPAPAAPPPAPAPVERPKADPERATATFAQTARPKPVAPAPVAKPKPPAPAAAPKKPAGPQWVFEGTVYDLLSTRGVYGVRLIFVDAEDNEVASVEAGEGGHYRASMKAGPAEGYTLRIVHDDYSGKHIDELDSTSSVRKADLEQRKFLMQAGARSLPWIGTVGKPVRRDMALVPKVAPE